MNSKLLGFYQVNGFLFTPGSTSGIQVYDTNNDGILREDDLREVLKAMIIENGMEFNDEEVQHVP